MPHIWPRVTVRSATHICCHGAWCHDSTNSVKNLQTSSIIRLLLGRPQAAARDVQAGCVTSAQAAQQIKQVLAARGAASGSNVGIGVVAMNSFEDATAWLKVRRLTQVPSYTRGLLYLLNCVVQG